MTTGETVIVVIAFVVTLVPAIVLHELAHGVVADRLGDRTARLAGRLTLNPVRHIDPFGSLILPGLLLLPYLFGRGGNPVFGYAKPVPVNPANLRKPEPHMLWIALAGPATNLLLAVVGAVAARLTSSVALFGNEPFPTSSLGVVLVVWVTLNVILAVFNILPIPPLDGSKVLARFLPPRAREVYRSLEPYGALFMLGIFFLLPGAIFSIVSPVVDGMLALLLG